MNISEDNDAQLPLVSICSTTYNHAPYIRECLDGFMMQQTNFPFEVLIHDDASTDGTADIIREYAEIKEVARPMLVRTYSGTKDVPTLAQIHEKSLNISWHALSLWWFCELDGRGKNNLLDNLKEHFEAIKYIASTGKPLEPNVPHHFAFRGADDITCIISGYLSAKLAKKLGIKHLILQNMLNTPKLTWGGTRFSKRAYNA